MEKAVETLRDLHPDWHFEILSLQDLDLSYLNRKSLSERDALLAARQYDHPRFDLARQFRDADGLIIAAPFWDLAFPAILKIYIENISVEGLTFRTGQEGLKGNCRSEWLLHLATRGGIWEAGQCQDSAYLQALTDFFGIGSYHTVSADGLDIQGMDAEGILAKALEQTQSICRQLA